MKHPLKKTEKIELIKQVQLMVQAGISKRKIAQILKISRNTIDKYVEGTPEFLAERTRSTYSKLHRYQSDIIHHLNQGFEKKVIYEYIVFLGYEGKLTQFYGYCRFLEKEGLAAPPIKLRRNELIDSSTRQIFSIITRHQIFKQLWCNLSEISEIDWETLKIRYPVIKTAENHIHEFRDLFTGDKDYEDLMTFINDHKYSRYGPLKRFVKSLDRDFDSVKYAVTTNYNNGFVEGVNNKLKMIKRIGYGRCSYKLLRSKMVLASFF